MLSKKVPGTKLIVMVLASSKIVGQFKIIESWTEAGFASYCKTPLLSVCGCLGPNSTKLIILSPKSK